MRAEATGGSNDGDSSAIGDGQRTTPVRNSIDVPSLASWMVRQPALADLLLFGRRDGDGDGDGGDSRSSSLARLAAALEDRLGVRQFGFGQSNPTYLLTIGRSGGSSVGGDGGGGGGDDGDDDADATIQLVLRRKPSTVAHPSSHALHREHRVLESLTRYNRQLKESGQGGEAYFDRSVPVPRPYAYCTDVTVIGSEFYIMEYVAGRIFVDPRMPSMEGGEGVRAAAYRDAIRVLAVSEKQNIHLRNIHILPALSCRERKGRIAAFFSREKNSSQPHVFVIRSFVFVRISTTSRGGASDWKSTAAAGR